MTDDRKDERVEHAQKSYTPETEDRSYRPDAGKVNESYTPETSQMVENNPPMPKKK